MRARVLEPVENFLIDLSARGRFLNVTVCRLGHQAHRRRRCHRCERESRRQQTTHTTDRLRVLSNTHIDSSTSCSVFGHLRHTSYAPPDSMASTESASDRQTNDRSALEWMDAARRDRARSSAFGTLDGEGGTTPREWAGALSACGVAGTAAAAAGCAPTAVPCTVHRTVRVIGRHQ